MYNVVDYDDDRDDDEKAHDGKTFGKRENFPVLIFSRVPFRLVAVDAQLALALLHPRVEFTVYICRTVKAISIFDSCSPRNTSVA